MVALLAIGEQARRRQQCIQGQVSVRVCLTVIGQPVPPLQVAMVALLSREKAHVVLRSGNKVGVNSSLRDPADHMVMVMVLCPIAEEAVPHSYTVTCASVRSGTD